MGIESKLPPSGVRRSETLDEREWQSALARIHDKDKRGRAEQLLAAYSKLRKRHTRVETRHQATLLALDRLPLAMVLVDRDSPVWANEPARRLLGADAPLKSDERGNLTFTDVAKPLIDALEQVRQHVPSRHAVLVGEWRVTLIGLELAEQPVLMSFSVGEGPTLAPEPEAFQTLFGLTAREARVATLLLGGRSGREIADALDVGFETARSHVKHVLRKMSCPRQAAAVLALAASPATIGPSPLPSERLERASGG